MRKKGFTLVEIIVVLVILAILAAAAIPSMLKFIDDAQGKAIITEARTAYIAAQMIATERKATEGEDYKVPTFSDIKKYLDIVTDIDIDIFDEDEDGRIEKIVYHSIHKGKTVTLEAGIVTTVS